MASLEVGTGSEEASNAADQNIPQPSACIRVFAIVELAEAICLDVPTRHILANVQRTCKHLQAVVEGSTPIQEALFLKPAFNGALRWEMPAWEPSWEEWEFGEVCESWTSWESKHTKHDAKVFSRVANQLAVHPVFKYLVQVKIDPSYCRRRCQIIRGQCAHVQAKFWRPKASWRKMQLTQPAVTNCKAVYNDGDSSVVKEFLAEEGSAGVTLGQLFDLEAGMTGNNPAALSPSIRGYAHLERIAYCSCELNTARDILCDIFWTMR